VSIRQAIVSTPRSGNTYLRMMLAHLYHLDQQAFYTPEEVPWRQLSENLIFLLHWPPMDDFRANLKQSNIQPIVIARHPLDLLVSILRFAQHSPDTHNWIGGMGGNEDKLKGATPTSHAFMDYALGERAYELLNINAAWWPLSEVARLRYEDLVASPEATMEKLAGQLNGDQVETVPAIIATYTPDFVRNTWKQFNHVWRARPNNWLKLITPDRARAIYTCHANIFETLGYSYDPTHSLSDEQAEINWAEMK